MRPKGDRDGAILGNNLARFGRNTIKDYRSGQNRTEQKSKSKVKEWV